MDNLVTQGCRETSQLCGIEKSTLPERARAVFSLYDHVIFQIGVLTPIILKSFYMT
jgi:hypothetical protein